MSELTVFVKLHCKPGKKKEVLKLIEEKCKPYMDASDAYDIYFQSSGYEDDNEIQIFEYFANDSEYWENCKADWFLNYTKELDTLLDGPKETFRAIPFWSKGVST